MITTYILLAILLLLLTRLLYIHYRPRFEILIFPNYIKVYLWYNSYEGNEYKGRVYKRIIKLRK